MTLIQTEPKSIKIWTTDVKKVYLGSTQVRPQNVKFVKLSDTITTSWWPNGLSSIWFSSIWKKILTSIYSWNNIYYWEASTSFPTTWTISFNSVYYWSTVRSCWYIDDSYFWVWNDSSVTLYSWTPSSRVSQWSISTAGRVRWACASPDWRYFYVADNQTNLKSYSLSTARNLSTATNTWTITTSNVRMLCYINDYKWLWPCVATLWTNFINVYRLNNNSISSAYIIANQTQSRWSSIYWWFLTPDCSKLYITVFNDTKIYIRENQN